VSLKDIVSHFPSLTIAVIGDAMADVYHWGRLTKLSQEAPVPVFVEDRRELRPGGAANVTANLKAWGIKVREHTFHTAVKHRYMAGHYQVFRIDEDYPGRPDGEWIDATVGELREGALDAIILSDYAKGTCREKVCLRMIQLARLREVPVIVDPKGTDWTKYGGATVLCPNQQEFAPVGRMWPDFNILEKRGEEGIQIHSPLYPQGGPLVPAKARHVFDPCGAGDTVVAGVAAAVAVGATLEQAAVIGNIAAGYVVGEVGTAVCPFDYLERMCASS